MQEKNEVMHSDVTVLSLLLPSQFLHIGIPAVHFKFLCTQQVLLLLVQLSTKCCNFGRKIYNSWNIDKSQFLKKNIEDGRCSGKEISVHVALETVLQDFSPIFSVRMKSQSLKNSSNFTYISPQKRFCSSTGSIHISTCKGTGKPLSTGL